MSRLRELIDQANTLWAPQERPFTSSVPLVGPVIISVRRAWNWMSAKWYVRPILEQQIAFNSTVVQIINEMSGILETQENRLEDQGKRLEEGLAQLGAQLEGLTAHLEQVEQEQARRLSDVDASLNNQVREAEEWLIMNDRAEVVLARDLAGLSHRLNEMGSRLPEELSTLKESVETLQQVLRGKTAVGDTDADSLL